MKKVITILLCIALSLTFSFGTLSALGETYQYTTWKQSDSRWGSISFGSVGDTMSSSGCAVTSIAILMVHSGAVSTDPSVFNPGTLVKWLNNNAGFTYQGWLYWNAVNGYTSKFSYNSVVRFSSGMTKADKIEEIEYYIDKGYTLVAEVNSGGHYVAINKVENGVAYIFDPANTGYDDLFDYNASGVLSIRLFKGPKASISSDSSSTTPNMTPGKVGIGTYVITSDDGLNIRSGAGSSYSKVGAIPYNTSVYVSDVSSNNWGKISYNGISGWITLEYAKMTVPVYIALQVTPPSKTTYKLGETLDTSGMTVTALYSDNTKKTITSGYTLSSLSSTLGTQTITVAYNGRGTTFTVTVTEFSTDVTYYTGTYKITSESGVNLRSQPNTASTVLDVIAYNQELTVTNISGVWGYTTFSGSSGWICLEYSIMISPEFTELQVTPPTKTVYTAGEQLNTSGMVVTAYYSNETQKTITSGYTISGYNTTAGTHTVTVSYGGKSDTFTVTVNSASTTPTYQLGTYRILSEDGMYVRANPNTSATILTAVPYNTQYVVTQISNGWGYTTVAGVTGWIYLEYSELIAAAETFTIEVELITKCFLVNNAVPSSAFKVYKVSNGTKTQITDYTLSSYDITTSGQKNITVTSNGKTAIMTVAYYDEVPKGDANFDGEITQNDALMILCVSIGKTAESSLCKDGADVDKDGEVSAYDALNVLQYAVGKTIQL